MAYGAMWWMRPGVSFVGERRGRAGPSMTTEEEAATAAARAAWSARAFARWLERRGARVPTFVRELGGGNTNE